jgi:hypothetical protein
MFATGISIVLLAFTAEKSMGFAAKWATADTSYVNCLSLAVVGWTDRILNIISWMEFFPALNRSG